MTDVSLSRVYERALNIHGTDIMGMEMDTGRPTTRDARQPRSRDHGNSNICGHGKEGRVFGTIFNAKE